ncbi:MAG: class E sortase [Ilumatobacteraceae bacterium]|nr:class E sortase [Ilumatobacteraceae bacterium]
MGCAALLVIASCGDDKSNASAATVAPVTSIKSTTTTSTTPATTSTSSTTTTSSSTTTSTSAAPTTSAVQETLPNPESPPADPRAPEPLVALGSIEIPAIGITKSMYEGITLTTLDHGPGHWPGTAMPGQFGNVVIAGHRVSHDKPFRNLDKLVEGDDVFLTTDDGRFDYKVTGTEIVTPDALWIADQTPDYTATLFACNPPGSTKQRIVVHLALAPAA